jgi:hypothetical protein
VIAKSANSRVRRPSTAWAILGVLLVMLSSSEAAAEHPTIDSSAIVQAFASSCDGYSSDELLVRDDLREKFLQSLSDAAGIAIDAPVERSALLHLLKLRKAGKLTVRATQRGDPVDESVMPAAEIAARVVTDRHRVTSDTMLADPIYRDELQHEAELISPGIDAYSVRKAVLSLRKRRALRPELVLKVADWDRVLRTRSLAELRGDLRGGAVKLTVWTILQLILCSV